MTAAAVISIVAAFAAGTPANAAENGTSLLVSKDGNAFTAGGDLQLFENAGFVVPGSRVTDDVWVKSIARADGRLRIDLTNISANDWLLARATTVAVQVGDDAFSAPVSLSDGKDHACIVVDGATLLHPGETTRVRAELEVDPTLGDDRQGDEGMRGSTSFEVRGTLFDAAVPVNSGVFHSCDVVPTPEPDVATSAAPVADDASGKSISITGTSVMWGALLGAPLLSALGLALLWRARRRKDATPA